MGIIALQKMYEAFEKSQTALSDLREALKHCDLNELKEEGLNQHCIYAQYASELYDLISRYECDIEDPFPVPFKVIAKRK